MTNWIGMKAPIGTVDGSWVALADGSKCRITGGQIVVQSATDVAALAGAGFTPSGIVVPELPTVFSGGFIRAGQTLTVVQSANQPSVLHVAGGGTVPNTPAGVASAALLSPSWATLQGPLSAVGKTFTWPSGDQSTVDSAGLLAAPIDAVNGMSAQGYTRANP